MTNPTITDLSNPATVAFGWRTPGAEYQVTFQTSAPRIGMRTTTPDSDGRWHDWGLVVSPERFGPWPTFDDYQANPSKARRIGRRWTEAFAVTD